MTSPKKQETDSLDQDALDKIEQDAMGEIEAEEWDDDTLTDALSASGDFDDPTIAGDASNEECVTSVQRPSRSSKLASKPSSEKADEDETPGSE